MTIILNRHRYSYIYYLILALLNVGTPPLLWAQERVIFNTRSNIQVTDSSWIKGMQLLNKTDVFARVYDKRLHIANLLSLNGDENAAIYWYHYALESPDITKKDSITTYNQLAISYNITGRFEASVKALLQRIRQLEDSVSINRTNIRIGNLYTYLNRFDKALTVIDQAMAYCYAHKDTFGLVMANTSKALLYKGQKKYDSSLRYSLASNYFSKKILEHTHLSTEYFAQVKSNNMISLNNIADDYIHLNLPDSAFLYLNSINSADIDSLKAHTAAIIYTTYGEAYAQKKEVPQAIHYFEKALGLQSNASSFYNIRTTAYKALSQLYTQTGDYRKAWEYEHAYSNLYVEVVSEENINKTSQLQNRYTMALKDKELAHKTLSLKNNELKLKQKKYQVYFLLLLMGFGVALILFVVRNYRIRQKLTQTQILNLEKENHITLVAATAQGEETERERIARELHDSVVSEASILKQNVQQLGKLVPGIDRHTEYNAILYQSENIKNRIRQVAHDLMPLNLKKLGLDQSILSYLDRISTNHLSLHFQTVGQVIALTDQKEKIVFMMIQELVQNIIKHAHATEAMVQLNYFEECVTLTVEDNGVGLMQQTQEQEGMGLYNIRHYVQTLNGHLDISGSEYTGTTVLIELPYNNVLSPTGNTDFP